jgi:predicted TPR repeat methyltransferase
MCRLDMSAASDVVLNGGSPRDRSGDTLPASVTSYDLFAPHFDAWQRAFGQPYDALVLPRVLAALDVHVPGARHVVDLGVGTGDLAAALARRGYAVTGVDCSAPMLGVAHAKLQAAGVVATLLLQDIRTLALDEPADAAVCVYTVLNQLTDDGDLARTFRAVRAALRPGGVFVFELNLPAAYDRYWTGTERVPAGDAVITRTHRRAAGSALVEADVTIVRAGAEVHDRIAQRVYSDEEVRDALAATGLVAVVREAFNPFERGAATPVKALWTVRPQRART